MSPATLSSALAIAREYQLSAGALQLLAYLGSHKTCTITTAAKEFNVTPTAISSLANRLLADDYIQKRPCDRDQRSTWLDITPAGEDCIKDILTGRPIKPL